MSSDAPTRITIIAEIVLDVTDPAALERAALAAIDVAEFGVVETGANVASVRDAEAEEVRGDPVAALSWLIDPERTVETIPGVTAGKVSWEVFPSEDDSLDAVLADDEVA